MQKSKTFNRKKILLVFFVLLTVIILLVIRLVYLMVFCSEKYTQMAVEVQQRERSIKAARGRILDVNGEVLATNVTVCTISVIHSQITDAERVIEVLAKTLEIDEDTVRKRVEKKSSIERIKTNVDKETGDLIRSYDLDGVKVDEDFKRYYPYDTLASKVLGFTGADNQGIIGLEVKYEEYLKGKNGKILTFTDARGVEIPDAKETRSEATPGYDLYTSLDYNIQLYAQQAAMTVMEEKEADSVSIIVMNPTNGEIKAMVNVPEFNLNEPYTLNTTDYDSAAKKQDLLNKMWRNQSINDTYEPGSTFKIITTASALEAGVLDVEDRFFCPGYKIVEDRRIRCHKTTGHGSQSFIEGIMNSCNPVFIELGQRIGTDRFYEYFQQFKLLEKTNIDLPGEAATIMHNKKNVGAVELATMSFGQSFQVTPIQMAVVVSSLVNGGVRVTPHLGVAIKDENGNLIKEFEYEEKTNIVSEDTSNTLKMLLENVVSEGTGKKAFIEGYSIGGKTATSQTLPRSDHKYIASFIGFAPANNPKVIAIVTINNPKGIYYGGTIAAPVIRKVFENILPYLEIEMSTESSTTLD